MKRIQVLLREEQARRLGDLARRLGVSKPTLIREGVESVLQRREAGIGDPLLDLVGQAGRVGLRSVSRSHDAYLMDVKSGRDR